MPDAAQDPSQDQDFLKAPAARQHAYLMANDPDYAKSTPDRQAAYRDHVTGAATAKWYGFAKPGPYTTTLAPEEEKQFQSWIKKNKVPFENDSPTSDYDMRGFWKGLNAGDPHAQTGINSVDHKLHYSDWWKTPYHETFSNESQYALPTAGHWEGEKFIPPTKTPETEALAHPPAAPQPITPKPVDSSGFLKTTGRDIVSMVKPLVGAGGVKLEDPAEFKKKYDAMTPQAQAAQRAQTKAQIAYMPHSDIASQESQNYLARRAAGQSMPRALAETTYEAGAGANMNGFDESVKEGNYPAAAGHLAAPPVLVAATRGAEMAIEHAPTVTAGAVDLAKRSAPTLTRAPGNLARSTARAIGKPYGLGATGEELLTQGISPRASATGFKESLQRASEDIKAFNDSGNAIKNAQDLNDAIPDIQRKIMTEEVNPAAKRHATEQLPDERLLRVKKAVEDSLSPFAEEFEPGTKKDVDALAEKMGKARTVQELIGTSADERGGLLGYVNAKLNSYFAKYPSARHGDLMANPDTAAWEAARRQLRQEAMEYLEDQGETGIREARQRWGALEDVGKEVERRVNVADRAKPMSINRILGLVAAPFTGGTSVIAGEIGHYLNKPDVLIRRGVERLPSRTPKTLNVTPGTPTNFTPPSGYGVAGQGVPAEAGIIPHPNPSLRHTPETGPNAPPIDVEHMNRPEPGLTPETPSGRVLITPRPNVEAVPGPKELKAGPQPQKQLAGPETPLNRRLPEASPRNARGAIEQPPSPLKPEPPKPQERLFTKPIPNPAMEAAEKRRAGPGTMNREVMAQTPTTSRATPTGVGGTLPAELKANLEKQAGRPLSDEEAIAMDRGNIERGMATGEKAPEAAPAERAKRDLAAVADMWGAFEKPGIHFADVKNPDEFAIGPRKPSQFQYSTGGMRGHMEMEFPWLKDLKMMTAGRIKNAMERGKGVDYDLLLKTATKWAEEHPAPRRSIQ